MQFSKKNCVRVRNEVNVCVPVREQSLQRPYFSPLLIVILKKTKLFGWLQKNNPVFNFHYTLRFISTTHISRNYTFVEMAKKKNLKMHELFQRVFFLDNPYTHAFLAAMNPQN